MENIGVIRKLMTQLFSYFYSPFVSSFENVLEQDSFIPYGSITKDDFLLIIYVSAVKLELIKQRWTNFISIHHLKMLSSYQLYLEYIIFACIKENEICDDISDSFLSVSAVLIAFNIEILEKTGVNFCEATLDIFMVFFENVLKERFCSYSAFQQFTTYVSQEYLAWEHYLKNKSPDSIVPVNNRDHFWKVINNLIEKQLGKSFYEPEFIAYNDIKTICLPLAKEVLSITKVKFPPLPSEADLNTFRIQELASLEEREKRRSVVSKSKMTSSVSKSETAATISISKKMESASTFEKMESASTFEKMEYASKSKTKEPVSKSESTTISKSAAVFQECESSDTDSQPGILIEKKKNISWCDNIVAAVINYNKSKNSSANVDKRLQEADEVMKNLKNNIKSLVDVLEYMTIK